MPVRKGSVSNIRHGPLPTYEALPLAEMILSVHYLQISGSGCQCFVEGRCVVFKVGGGAKSPTSQRCSISVSLDSVKVSRQGRRPSNSRTPRSAPTYENALTSSAKEGARAFSKL